LEFRLQAAFGSISLEFRLQAASGFIRLEFRLQAASGFTLCRCVIVTPPLEGGTPSVSLSLQALLQATGVRKDPRIRRRV
jgi:hypothetical protein